MALKRTPLQRRTPLQVRVTLGNNGASLKRGSTRMPKTKRVKPMSDKRVADAAARKLAVAELLARFPRCQAQWACRGAMAVEVHERLKRSRGGSIVDLVQSHAITICRPCHELTEAKVAEATVRRMLLPSWHQCPTVGPC